MSIFIIEKRKIYLLNFYISIHQNGK